MHYVSCDMQNIAKFQTFKGAKLAWFSVKSVAIPAIDLTINSDIAFERV